MPWEIMLASDTITHTLYTKSGDLPGHSSNLLVSPDLSFAVIAFSCGKESKAGDLALETERVISPFMQQALGKKTIEAYAGIYQLNCSKKCNGCGEIVIEIDMEMKITRMVDCDGTDIFTKFDAKCKKQECFAKLWPTGRAGEFR
jgi:hypothetical protein